MRETMRHVPLNPDDLVLLNHLVQQVGCKTQAQLLHLLLQWGVEDASALPTLRRMREDQLSAVGKPPTKVR